MSGLPNDAELNSLELFEAICTVRDGAMRALYPKQEYLREQLADLQRWCGIEHSPREDTGTPR